MNKMHHIRLKKQVAGFLCGPGVPSINEVKSLGTRRRRNSKVRGSLAWTRRLRRTLRPEWELGVLAEGLGWDGGASSGLDDLGLPYPINKVFWRFQDPVTTFGRAQIGLGQGSPSTFVCPTEKGPSMAPCAPCSARDEVHDVGTDPLHVLRPTADAECQNVAISVDAVPWRSWTGVHTGGPSVEDSLVFDSLKTYINRIKRLSFGSRNLCIHMVSLHGGVEGHER